MYPGINLGHGDSRCKPAERSGREEAIEEAAHWQDIERLRRHPTEEHARAAKRALLWLAKRHHADSGGSHQGFLRVKNAYDRARGPAKGSRAGKGVKARQRCQGAGEGSGP